jgi:transcriptional regulator with XRE-family HTH domain
MKTKGNNNWGERLKTLIKEKGLTLRKASTIAGVSPSVIDSWINGASPTDLIAVKKLADHLDISFTWLLTGENEKGNHEPTVTEIFEETPYFDGLARIRIDRLMPRKKVKT